MSASATAPLSEYDRARSETDPCLQGFLFAPTETEAKARYSRLDAEFVSADVVATVVRELWRGKPLDNAELFALNDSLADLSVGVRGKLCVRLWRLRERFAAAQAGADSVPEPLRDLRAYTVATAERGCVDYLRRKYPGRYALEVALRTSCNASEEWARWRVTDPESDWLIGRAAWRDTGVAPRSLRSDPALSARLRAVLNGVAHTDALPIIFDCCAAPLFFNELLGFLAGYWDVERVYRMQSLEQVPFTVGKTYQSGIEPEEIIRRVGVLQEVWDALTPLSPKQSAVLLLKSPPFGDIGFLDELTRFEVATWEEVGVKIGFSVARVQELSASLPLSDEEIAGHLGIAPDVVRRVRQDARLRMARRIKKSTTPL